MNMLITLALLFSCEASTVLSPTSASEILQEKSDRISLSYKLAQVLPEPIHVKVLEQKLIRTIIQKQQTELGEFFLFQKPWDVENVFAGFKGKPTLYDLGVVSHSTKEVSLTPVELFGKKLLEIKGLGGAKWSYHNYYDVENGVPRIVGGFPALKLLIVGQGKKQYAIVTNLLGVVPTVWIYKLENNQVVRADLAEALHAQAVQYVPERNEFRADFGQNRVKYYTLLDDTLISK
ncbi:hypothetical protein ACQCN2_19335 [Brevibacillus ginsengisoli]|uniref:hypothetical protein n=1 Tax=Brevibacillus ginsengisoli TaxID=363854 RepID=UPI003CE6A545